MLLDGVYTIGNVAYNVLARITKTEGEVALYENGIMTSAFRSIGGKQEAAINMVARDFYNEIAANLKKRKSKGSLPVQFIYGTAIQYTIKNKSGICKLSMFDDIIVQYESSYSDRQTQLYVCIESKEIYQEGAQFVELSSPKKDTWETDATAKEEDVATRTVEEIVLYKSDNTWYKKKKYYIINDDETAEQIFSFLDTYKGKIAYDTETTGTRINCFGKIGSKYSEDLAKWNQENPDNKIRADKLVGIIFCVEEHVSYYFPVANRKFKNLYEDKSSPVRKKITSAIKSRYMVAERWQNDTDMARVCRNTAEEDLTPDVILMERVRGILEHGDIVAHNGEFEYKVGMLYDIDTNLRDDTMLMHQLVYKYRVHTKKGEPSNLKHLSKVELGIEQWDLEDFFPEYKEDTSGRVVAGSTKGRKRKYNSKIDFSYMDYEGTKIYAPADGDCTLLLYKKYSADINANHRDILYIYNVEVLVSCAVAYMEFYGHRLDQVKLTYTRDIMLAKHVMCESKIRQLIKYSDEKELEVFARVRDLVEYIENKVEKENVHPTELNDKYKELEEARGELRGAIDANKDYVLNVGAPAQMSKIIYGVFGAPKNKNGSESVDESNRSRLMRLKENGKAKYEVVHLYDEYVSYNTLLIKFFDNLGDFMYPGGFIFPSYGQINTATGRMSCRWPNAQQYPEEITRLTIPREDCVMVDADYKQIEYRVLSALAGEEVLIESFRDFDNDYHRVQAALMFDTLYAAITKALRSAAKAFNFGIPFGMGPASLAILLHGDSEPDSVKDAKEKRVLYFKNQPKVEEFFTNVKEQVKVHRVTKTLWGRKRHYHFSIESDKELDPLVRARVRQARMGSSMRQGGNAVVQGTAADIYKIAIARIFQFIRKEKLFGKFFISNMIHDEVLSEVNFRELDVRRVIAEIGNCMQYSLDGFPPLYMGAGLGLSWYEAKSEDSEIHFNLWEQIKENSKNISIKRETRDETTKDHEWRDYMTKLIEVFKWNKAVDALKNEQLRGNYMTPAVMAIIVAWPGMKAAIKNVEGNINKHKAAMDEFIKLSGLQGVSSADFLWPEEEVKKTEEVKEKVKYEDVEHDGGEEEYFDDEIESSFEILDEDSVTYGSSIQDIIREFGMLISMERRICGIDVRDMTNERIEAIARYLESKECGAEEPNSLEVLLLKDNNELIQTGIYVSMVYESDLSKL